MISGILVADLECRRQLAVRRCLRLIAQEIYLVGDCLVGYVGLGRHAPDDLICLGCEYIGHDERLFIHPARYALCLEVVILVDDIYLLAGLVIDAILKRLRADE